jgi:hypothetical protein
LAEVPEAPNGGPLNNKVLANALIQGKSNNFVLTCSTCGEAPLVRTATGAIICSAWCDIPGEDTIETWAGPSLPGEEHHD